SLLDPGSEQSRQMLEKSRPVSLSVHLSFLSNWIVHTHEFGAIRESGFHFHLRNHFRNAFHDLTASQDLGASRHELSDRLTVACAFQDEICYQRNTLGEIELNASGQPFARDPRGERDHKLVFFSRCQVHKFLPLCGGFSTTTSSARGKDLDRMPG